MNPMELSEADKLRILASLKKPASMALVELEAYKTHPAALDFIWASEALGKCRWSVMNQAKLWRAAGKSLF